MFLNDLRVTKVGNEIHTKIYRIIELRLITKIDWRRQDPLKMSIVLLPRDSQAVQCGAAQHTAAVMQDDFANTDFPARLEVT